MYVFTDDEYEAVANDPSPIAQILVKIMNWIEDTETLEHEAGERE